MSASSARPAEVVSPARTDTQARPVRVAASVERVHIAPPTRVEWLPTLALFAVVSTVGMLLAGAVTCGDGWVSPSIERRGSCPYHNGVNSLPRLLVLLAAVVAAVVFHSFHLRRARDQQAIDARGWMLPAPRG